MNLYDVLAGQGTTHFERLFSHKFAVGGKTQTLTGVPPLTFNANGSPLISWSMKGNGQQSGTPSPSNILPFDGTGERTGNLFDKSSATVYNAYFNDSNTWIESDDSRSVVIPVNGETQYTLSVPEAMSVFRICEATRVPVIRDTYYRIVRASSAMDRYTFITRSDAKYIIFQGGRTSLDTWFNGLMLNTGGTALPYEPYGYKIPLTCASVTTPLYLGEQQTVRRIKKLVLTGSGEDWIFRGGEPQNVYFLEMQNLSVINNLGICTHYPNQDSGNFSSFEDKHYMARVSTGGTKSYLAIRDSSFAYLANFKSYLAAQYAAGTPVTVWYVLAEPETGIVNEPLYRIGDYCDELTTTTPIPTAKGSNTLTVDTTVQPNEMTITYKG